MCQLRIGHDGGVRSKPGPGNLAGIGRVLEQIAVAGGLRHDVGIVGDAVDLDGDGRAVLALEGGIEHAPVGELARIDLLDQIVLDRDRALSRRHQKRVVSGATRACLDLRQLVLRHGGRNGEIVARRRYERREHAPVGILPAAGKRRGDQRAGGARPGWRESDRRGACRKEPESASVDSELGHG